MKVSILSRALAQTMVLLCCAAGAVAADPPGDELKAIDEENYSIMTTFTPGQTVRQAFEERGRRARALQERALAFYEKYPADPRRWEAASLVRTLARAKIIYTTFKPEFDQVSTAENTVVDTALQEKWAKKGEELGYAMAAAGDVPRSKFIAEDFEFDITQTLLRARENPGTVNMLALRQRVEDLAARYPDADVSGAAERFTAALTRMSPSTSARGAWEVFENSPNSSLVTISRLYLGKGSIDLPAFTAVDGRKVDLAALRGKVVLVDFWSTSCGACIQDLPKLKAVFERYHGKGFEIVGVALQNSDRKREMINLLDEYQVTWPQYYDGKGWLSDPAVSNAVTDLPTNYLIDQQGRVVGFGTRKNSFKADKIEVKLKALLEKQGG